MKIEVPDEEQYQRDKKRKRIHGAIGILFGLIFFGFAGLRIFIYGLDEVAIYTWIALGFGITSFGFLAYKFGDEFWTTLFNN